MLRDKFWNNIQVARDINRERTKLEYVVNAMTTLNKQLEDIEILLELAKEEGDNSVAKEVQDLLIKSEREMNLLENTRLLGQPEDSFKAIISINAGAGGTDAQDWAQMLLRQYSRFAERYGFGVVLLDLQEGEEAGIKSATVEINGHYAYGILKGEAGVHRLIRISPFDGNRRRHTAFASIFVLPQVVGDIEIDIREADLRVDVFRASGAGGQHVNKTSSAVRLTHLSTGVVVQCQNEKSQHRNKELAMKVLRARLYEIELTRQEAEKKQIHYNHQEIAWGNQIRSYVLAPYRLVKDHRTGIGVSNVDTVLDGNLDSFIRAYLFWKIDSKY